jgi:hypothetical protein
VFFDTVLQSAITTRTLETVKKYCNLHFSGDNLIENRQRESLTLSFNGMKITITYKYLPKLLGIILLILAASGCVKPKEIQKLSGNAQGTSYHISFSS